MINKLLPIILAIIFSAGTSLAQTSSFTFQGKLNDGATAATGTYDFYIRMFDASSGGNQIGGSLLITSINVTSGIFTVNLDFGASSFDGGARYLEIGVRQSGTNTFQLLSPRQQVTSTPYAVKSLKSEQATTANNSLNLGGIAANQYIITNDTRLSDDRNPLPDSPNYIQNTTNPQTTANFNISGEGKANIFNAASEFRINNSRVFHLTGTDNAFVGFQSGNSITTGGFNAFFGSYAGKGTTIGSNNAFFGSYAGRDNVSGTNNAFFGTNAGLSNKSSFNAFFGSGAGFSNINGANNSYFGNQSGANNSTGDNNSFFGSNAGKSTDNSSFNSFFGSFTGEKTTTGAGNTFVGAFAGRENQIGFNNTFIGYKAGQMPTTGNGNVLIGYNSSAASGVSNSIAIGQNVQVSSSNTIQIGNANTQNTYLNGNLFTGDISAGNIGGTSVSASSISGGAGTFNALSADKINITPNLGNQQPSTFVNAEFKEVQTDVIRIKNNTVNAGVTPLCAADPAPGFNQFYRVVICSSSIRYKDNVQNFTRGLDLLRQLRPVTFNWKTSGTADVGFIAEEINQAEPLLTVYNSAGQVEGVKYAQITTVLVNSVKEQQTQIENLQEQIKRHQEQIEALKILVCAQNQAATICQSNKDK